MKVAVWEILDSFNKPKMDFPFGMKALAEQKLAELNAKLKKDSRGRTYPFRLQVVKKEHQEKPNKVEQEAIRLVSLHGTNALYYAQEEAQRDPFYLAVIEALKQVKFG